MNPRARRALPVVLALAVGLLVGCSGGKNAVDQSAGQQWRYPGANKKGTLTVLADRKPAGLVTGNLIGGGSYRLSQDRGKVVVLNFFASWCAPCQTETPQFDSIYRARKAQGVQFVGLDVKDPSKSGAQAWLQNKQISFPVVYDEPGKTALQLGDVPLTGLPATVLIDRQGRVAAIYTQEVFPADLEPVLNQLISESS
ncbi:MAG TPA: TlpA disulfide reductase family protein [Jatrophihabitans sp.]|nr:TlpA disulfide reductase family protein [Jatrophihabitans sp.]